MYCSPVARRVLSLLLTLSFGFFTAEVALADSCDGDATTSAIRAPAGTDSGPAPARQGTHNVPHVCHCAHAHGTVKADPPQLAGSDRSTRQTLTFATQEPAAVDLDVHLRPPIAA